MPDTTQGLAIVGPGLIGTSIALAAERAFLTILDGSCRTPIGGFAELVDGAICFRGIIVSPDGVRAHATERRGNVDNGVRLAAEAGAELRERGGPAFLDGG